MQQPNVPLVKEQEYVKGRKSERKMNNINTTTMMLDRRRQSITNNNKKSDIPNNSSSSASHDNDNNKNGIVVYSKTRICIKNVPYKLVVENNHSSNNNVGKKQYYSGNALRQFILQRLNHSISNNNNKGKNLELGTITITDCRILSSSNNKAVMNNNSTSKKNLPKKQQPQQQLYYIAIIGFSTAEQASYAIQQLHRTYYQTTKLHVEYATLPQSSVAKVTTTKTETATESKEDSTTAVKKASKDVDNKQKSHVDLKKQEFLSAMGISVSVSNDQGTTTTTSATTNQQQASMLSNNNNHNNESSSIKRPFWSNDDHDLLHNANNTHEDDNNNDDDDDSSSTVGSLIDNDDNDDDDDDDHMLDPIQHHHITNTTTTNSTTTNTDNKTTTSSSSAMDFLRSKQVNVMELLPKDVDNDDDIVNVDADDSNNNLDEVDTKSSIDNDNHLLDSTNDRIIADDSINTNEQLKVSTDDKNNNIDDAMLETEDINDEETNFDPNRIFIRNLPFTITEDEIRQHFQKYGTIVECHLCIDDQYRNKGYGFISYSDATAAYTARMECDARDYYGRILHIIPAQRKKGDNTATAANQNTTSYKDSNEEKRRLNAATDQKGWNTTHVRDDAVLDNLAVRLGLRSKSELLNVKDTLKSGDAAVRLALGETAIIDENRKYFLQHGIDMETLVSFHNNSNKEEGSSSINTKMDRSTTSILVKNLPFETSYDELKQLFVGNNVTILLAPSKTIAVVQYIHPNDAKVAFRKLAYRRFKSVPLYLEWAPLAAINDNMTNKSSSHDETTALTSIKNDNDNLLKKNTDEDDDDQILLGPTTTLYVKNLNFNTTEDQLRDFFLQYDSHAVRTVRIPQKVVTVKRDRVDPTMEQQQQYHQSMGYGFVELNSQEMAKTILKKAQGAQLDGHALELRISSSSATTSISTDQSTKKGKEKKLMVRNVPFQATRKELLQLFGSFGTLKKVRLPKKFDGSHRGYAFVEYVTAKDCVHAMQILSKTHLYGRHLVLEYAAADEDVDDLEFLRSKAERDVSNRTTTSTIAPPQNKKIRFE